MNWFRRKHTVDPEVLREEREVWSTEGGRTYLHTMCRMYPTNVAAKFDPQWLVDEINRQEDEHEQWREERARLQALVPQLGPPRIKQAAVDLSERLLSTRLGEFIEEWSQQQGIPLDSYSYILSTALLKYLRTGEPTTEYDRSRSGFTRVAGKPLFFATREGVDAVREMLIDDWSEQGLRRLVEDLLRTIEVVCGLQRVEVEDPKPPIVDSAEALQEREIALQAEKPACSDCEPLADWERDLLQPGPDDDDTTASDIDQMVDTCPPVQVRTAPPRVPGGGVLLPMPDPYSMRKTDTPPVINTTLTNRTKPNGDAS